MPHLSFPILPPHPSGYLPSISNAIQIIKDPFQSTHAMLASANFDLHRIESHIDLLIQTTVPLLLDVVDQRIVPATWCTPAMESINELMDMLMDAWRTSQGR